MKWIESYLFKSAANSDQKIKSFKYSRSVQMWYIEKSLPAWNFHHNKNINVKYLPSINQNCLFRSIMWYKSFAHMEHHGVDCGKQARANNQRETSQNKKPSTINTVFHSPVDVLCCCLAIFPVHLHHLYHLAHKHYHTHSIDHISVCYSRLGQRAVAISFRLFLSTFFFSLDTYYCSLLFVSSYHFFSWHVYACIYLSNWWAAIDRSIFAVWRSMCTKISLSISWPYSVHFFGCRFLFIIK